MGGRSALAPVFTSELLGSSHYGASRDLGMQGLSSADTRVTLPDSTGRDHQSPEKRLPHS